MPNEPAATPEPTSATIINVYDTSLYTITGATAAAIARLEQIAREADDMTPEQIQAAQDAAMAQLAEAMDALPDKLVNCAKYVKSLERQIAGIKDEVTALQEKARAVENRLESFKAYMLMALERLPAGVKTDTMTISTRKTEALVITDEEMLPIDHRFWHPPKPATPNLPELKRALKAGTPLEGCELKTGKCLVIR